MGGVKIEGVGRGEGMSPSALGRGLCSLPRKKIAFLASKLHVCDAL